MGAKIRKKNYGRTCVSLSWNTIAKQIAIISVLKCLLGEIINKYVKPLVP